jgi:hypothetical protein
MSSLSVRIRYEPLRSLAFGGISGTYAAIGTTFANPVRILKITNLTDANLLISFDGVTDRDIIPANTIEVLDYGSNKADTGGQLDQSVGDRVYVKQSGGAATSGSVYVTVIYASAN